MSVPYRPHELLYLHPEDEVEGEFPFYDYPIWGKARKIRGFLTSKIPVRLQSKVLTLKIRNPHLFSFNLIDFSKSTEVVIGGKFLFGKRVFYICDEPKKILHNLPLDHIKVFLDELTYPNRNDKA